MDKGAVLSLIRNKAKEFETHGYPEFAVALDNIADKIEDMPEPTATRSKEYTPIHKLSPITYPTWRCTNCGAEDRYRKGVYCKYCGRKFEE